MKNTYQDHHSGALKLTKGRKQRKNVNSEFYDHDLTLAFTVEKLHYKEPIQKHSKTVIKVVSKTVIKNSFSG